MCEAIASNTSLRKLVLSRNLLPLHAIHSLAASLSAERGSANLRELNCAMSVSVPFPMKRFML